LLAEIVSFSNVLFVANINLIFIVVNGLPMTVVLIFANNVIGVSSADMAFFVIFDEECDILNIFSIKIGDTLIEVGAVINIYLKCDIIKDAVLVIRIILLLLLVGFIDN
jgi:hypothetical protein